jgi:hypothetical protein
MGRKDLLLLNYIAGLQGEDYAEDNDSGLSQEEDRRQEDIDAHGV